MRKFFFILFLLCVTCPASAQVGSTHVPVQLPKDIKNWEEFPSCGNLPPCVLHLANADLEYDLYSEPSRPLLYAVTHYRLRPLEKKMQRKWIRDRHYQEGILWIDHEKHAHLFVHERHRSFKTLWMIPHLRWREMKPDLNRLNEMSIAWRVWSIHALITVHDTRPEDLFF